MYALDWFYNQKWLYLVYVSRSCMQDFCHVMQNDKVAMSKQFKNFKKSNLFQNKKLCCMFTIIYITLNVKIGCRKVIFMNHMHTTTRNRYET